ncbi:sensor histidine kinase [Streptomyces sp. NRRL F-5126]|uniref:sensor histidine kinase n=1 Tax=Streptomyces sp. NRRL F-5126 TaxID=1463857 RepID=UPI00068D136F|nr:histidine kinase [Streptomyces sp. NRRL F-5126]
MDTTTTPTGRTAAVVQGSRGLRVLAAVGRDPADAPHPLRADGLLALALMALSALLALAVDNGRTLDGPGWALLALSVLPLVWRRRHTMAALAAMVVFVASYHALRYDHPAALPASLVMIYTVAATVRPLRTLLIAVAVVCLNVGIQLGVDPGAGFEALKVSGWLASVFLLGAYLRIYRGYVASIVERAERAERTREEEAARRVAQERLRIARDLHDLLAHSITTIGVQASVASHVLEADPGRLDRAAVAAALDGIADTCRTARAEVKATLDVLRCDAPGEFAGGAAEGRGPLPGLAALPGLVRAAGAGLTLHGTGGAVVPPAVDAAAYRIVQESLTNAARHAGPGARTEVTVERRGGALRVGIVDDGSGAARDTATGGDVTGGYGILGMRERARSVGGSLTAGPRAGGGFAVEALLPLEQGDRTAAADEGGRP